MVQNSDAYIRADLHTLSIEQWLSKMAQKDYFKWMEEEPYNTDLEGQILFPVEPRHIVAEEDPPRQLIGLVGRNGDNRRGYPGANSSDIFPLSMDGFCSGVGLWRNSTLTHRFLDEWYNASNDDSFDGISPPYEQPRMNRVLQQYKDNVFVVPYLEIVGPESVFVRHLWSIWREWNPDSDAWTAVTATAGALDLIL